MLVLVKQAAEGSRRQVPVTAAAGGQVPARAGGAQRMRDAGGRDRVRKRRFFGRCGQYISNEN